MLARGGDKNEKAPWGDAAIFKEISKYAKFVPNKEYGVTEPVGQLLPNGYGLYDMFGLVEEHVLFQAHNRLRDPFMYNTEIRLLNDYKCHYDDCPSCLKGGGFRLIRNIGNNAKWSDVNR